LVGQLCTLHIIDRGLALIEDKHYLLQLRFPL
jgi:hypothetical protein